MYFEKFKCSTVQIYNKVVQFVSFVAVNVYQNCLVLIRTIIFAY